jgi:hypothetical protein
MLSDNALYDWLVRIGTMPAIAERIVADSQSGKLPTEAEMDEDAKITDEDIELAAAWWLYTPAVPRKFKRLLHAKKSR